MDERVGNAQRTMALDLLSTALEEGYLDLAEYEQRMSAVTAAKMVSDLTRQLADLPDQFRWDPRRTQPPMTMSPSAPPATDKGASSAQTTSMVALILGIVSLPMSLCLGAGALFGIGAIILSRPGLRLPVTHGKAITGLVLGTIGIFLSVGFIALWLIDIPTPTPSTTPN